MPIPTIRASVLSYFRSFDLSSIALTRDQRLISTANPEGCVQAWWLQAYDVGLVLDRARSDHGDVEAAAAALRIKLVPHADALQRTEELVNRLDARVAHAQETGGLSIFNREYRRRRLRAQAAGEPFLPYRVAQRRLRQALADVAAGKAAPGIIGRVFGDRLPDPQ